MDWGWREYGGEGLHAEDEGVGGHVAGVGEGVLFPELAEEIRHACHACVVEHEVAFEEEVDGAACCVLASVSSYAGVRSRHTQHKP